MDGSLVLRKPKIEDDFFVCMNGADAWADVADVCWITAVVDRLVTFSRGLGRLEDGVLSVCVDEKGARATSAIGANFFRIDPPVGWVCIGFVPVPYWKALDYIAGTNVGDIEGRR